MPLPKANIYTTKDIYVLPEGQRAELIDGQIYDIAPPNRMHQKFNTIGKCHRRIYFWQQRNVNKETKSKRTAIKKQEAYYKLEHLKKKETITDYDMELAVYREQKYI